MEIIGIGVDQIERARVEKACAKESFCRRLFSKQERELIQKRPSCAATNFAGKEAVAKAFGTGFCGIEPREIEILRDQNGAPVVRLTGEAKKSAKARGVKQIQISLSDTKETAIAFVVLVG